MKPGVALVTGAGARLGKAMAIALGENGWAVVVHYRSSREGAEATANAIREAGGEAAVLQADLSVESETKDLIDKASALFSRPVTLLVNSASTFANDTATAHARDDWDFHMEANLRAPVSLAGQLAHALPNGEAGLVVNMIDQRVWNLSPDYFTYTISKAALWQATKTLAQALAPHVRVNGIGPGPTLRNAHQSEAEFAEEKRATLTGEGSSPDEIVKALRYLVSASSVTGQMIASDGGQHLMWYGA